jgi:hypothetical protein
MTTAQLVEMTTAHLSYDLDSYVGEAPTDEQVVRALNYAQRLISHRVHLWHPSVELALVAGRAVYSLENDTSLRVVRPYSVIVGGLPLLNAARDDYGLWSYQEMERRSPAWRAEEPGVPRRAVHNGLLLILNPAPNPETVARGSHYVSGQVLAPDLDAAEPERAPELPSVLHETLALAAAVHLATPMASEQEQWTRLAAFKAEIQPIIEDLRRENMRAVTAFGTTSLRSGADDYIHL